MRESLLSRTLYELTASHVLAPVFDDAAQILQQQRGPQHEIFDVLALDLERGHFFQRVCAGRARLTGQSSSPRNEPSSSRLSGPPNRHRWSMVRPDAALDQKRHARRHFAGVLHDFVGAVTNHPRVRDKHLLVGEAQAQCRRHHISHRHLHPRRRGEIVGLRRRGADPSRRAAYQIQRRKVAFAAPSSAGDFNATLT